MPTLSTKDLIGFAADIIRRGGSSPQEAVMVATNLVEANLQGHDSHGVGMIPRYVQALLQGGLKANTPAKLLADHGAILVFDGQSGYGQVVARQVMEAAIGRAKTTGVCITSLKNAHHLGRIGAWAEQCCEAGLVSVHFANVYSRAIVAPFNGADRRLGTNPFCVGVPTADHHAPLILDFATSAIASGKVRVASNRGESLEPGVAIDANGAPTVNPADILSEPMGALLPFGKHKGGGLALICSLLGAALTGSPTERLTKPGDLRILNGMLSIIINPAMLGGAESFIAEIDAFLPWVRQSRPITGEVLFPGEPERRRKALRSRDGIEVDDETWRQLLEAKESLAH